MKRVDLLCAREECGVSENHCEGISDTCCMLRFFLIFLHCASGVCGRQDTLMFWIFGCIDHMDIQVLYVYLCVLSKHSSKGMTWYKFRKKRVLPLSVLLICVSSLNICHEISDGRYHMKMSLTNVFSHDLTFLLL